jgi:hypothetical protein
MFSRIARFSILAAAFVASLTGMCRAQVVAEELPPPAGLTVMEMREINYWSGFQQRHPSFYERVLAQNSRVRDLMARVGDMGQAAPAEAKIETPAPAPVETRIDPPAPPSEQPEDSYNDGR